MPMGSLWVVARTGGEKWIRDMSFRELRYIWYADLYRYEGRADSLAFVKHFLLSPGFTYTFYLRLCAYLAQKRPRVLFLPLYILARICLRHYSYKFSIFIPPSTRIGIGFYIGHCGDIHVNPDTQIGRNCNMSQGVTLGQANRGSRKGTPVVGDGVYIGPGVKVVGAVRIGNNVAIGANCVVTRDAEDQAVVAGIPGRTLSYEGSTGYIDNTDYQSFETFR